VLDYVLGGMVGSGNTVIRAGVVVASGFVQMPHAERIPCQRTMGFLCDSGLDDLKRRIQPDGYATAHGEFEIFLNGKRAATERDYLRPPVFGTLHEFTERRSFQLSECHLSLVVENVNNRHAGDFFNFGVEFTKPPAELVGQPAADGGFAASHESNQVDGGGLFQLEYHLSITARVSRAARESHNSSMQEWLPLFPLQVVLLPESELPLHIFEERYKEMIQDVLRDKIEFGVVMASEKGLVNTGCTATIEKVLRQYPDGRMDILALGRRRFEIGRLNDDRSYLRGEVEFFTDEDAAAVAPEARRQAIDGYNELQALSASPPLPAFEAANGQLSFRLGQAVNDLSLRQALLAARSEAERIRQLAAFLPAYVTRQKQIQHVKQAAPRNGHGHKLPGLE